MAPRSTGSAVYVDWFNVTYRSVFTTVGILVLLLVGGGGSWYWKSVYQPRIAASEAIDQASGAFREAQPFGDSPDIKETVYRAGQALDEARSSFESRRFDDAEFSALHSHDLSRKAIQMGGGGGVEETTTARFYKLEGDVRLKKAGEFSWENASARDVLRVGDQVKTSSSASAQVIYFDGTVTTVEPGSLLEIRELFEDPITRVRRVREKLSFGELKASIKKKQVDGSYHEVSTDKVTARAEKDTEFRVAYDKTKKTAQFDVFKGEVTVKSPGTQESVKGGERIRAAADGSLGNREALPGVPRLRSPADQRTFVFQNTDNEQVTVSWEQLQGSSTYHLMIATKPLFTDPLFAGDRNGGSASLEGLAEGTYFWKVAAKRGGVKGPFSDVRTFRISSKKIKDREDTVPPSLEIADFVAVGGMVIINGRAEPGASLWIDNEKIDVYDDGSFNAVIRLQRDGLNEIQFIAQDNAGNETRKKKSTFAELY